MYLADTTTMRAEKIDFPAGLNYFSGNPTPFSKDGNRLLVAHESSTRPGDIWVYDLAAHSARQLTYSAVASLEAIPLPSAQIVHDKTFDGKIISALLWMPFNLKRDSTNAAIVLPHGEPTGQMVDYWNPEVAALVSRGYICISPNVRGSAGYGIEFQKANYQDLGGGDLQDEVYATKFLVATGYVNPKKIGIAGGSCGGYMTLMAAGKTPDVWAAGVEEYGIINWFTMLQHEDALLQEYAGRSAKRPQDLRGRFTHHLHSRSESATAGAARRQRSTRSQGGSAAGGGLTQEGRRDRGRSLLFERRPRIREARKPHRCDPEDAGVV